MLKNSTLRCLFSLKNDLLFYALLEKDLKIRNGQLLNVPNLTIVLSLAKKPLQKIFELLQLDNICYEIVFNYRIC